MASADGHVAEVRLQIADGTRASMSGRLRRRLVDAVPENALRRVQAIRHRDMRGAESPRRVPRAVIEDYDAHAQRRAVVTEISAALDAARVDHVLVPGRRGIAKQVAVSAEDRPTALAALRGRLSGRGWLVEPAGRPARRRVDAAVLRVHRAISAPSGAPVPALDTACEVAFWTSVTSAGRQRAGGQPHTPGTRLAPNDNGVVGYLSADAWRRAISSPARWPVAEPLPDLFEFREPVDIVYTWVDGDDPDWRARRAAYPHRSEEHHVTAADPARYLSRDELRYSLRSVAMFARWARRIYIVTDGQTPAWLDTDHPQIEVVDHKQIFGDPSVLPVFNSHAIESQLHHIPGLGEHYLYLNDDFFFGRAVEPETFFHANGIAKFFLATGTLDLDPSSARDLPVLSAAKNQRMLLERDFGVTVRHKFRHVPQAQVRSVVQEMEDRYHELFAQVAASRFRHPDDVSIPSAFAHYYAYVTGRAAPGDIQYRYQDLAGADTARRLDEFLRERPQVFCLNDIDSPRDKLEQQQATLREFFAAYYPLPSPYEKGP